MFADDTQYIARGPDLSALIDPVNLEELKKISAWFRANRMAVNADTSNFIIFHLKGRRVDMEGKSLVFDNNDHDAPHDPSLVTILDCIHNNHTDKNSRSIKQLGVRLDENLTFQANHDAIVSKLNPAVFMINRIKNFIPSRALKTLYHSLFHCHLMYCPIITSCSSPANIEKLFKIQKKGHPHYHTLILSCSH
jgi:hypothetical protein